MDCRKLHLPADLSRTTWAMLNHSGEEPQRDTPKATALLLAWSRRFRCPRNDSQ